MRCVWSLVLVAIRVVSCYEEESFLDTSEAQEAKTDQNQQQQQGSWAHWWTYDGISGPDYWNINKRWRLCSLGRKQSPVDIRTERLVYDHLLGAIHLDWSPAADKQNRQSKVRVRLVNSGRGVEAWLPEGPSSGSQQLVLSRGPLSYEYNLFKIELHSATVAQQQAKTANGRISRRDASAADSNELRDKGQPSADEHREEDADDDSEAPEHLRSGKSSEHLIDGRSFDAELQLHFYNRRLASSVSEAQQLAGQDEGRPSLFAAISVFLVAATTATTGNQSSANPVDELMLNNLGSLENQGDSLELSLDRQLIERLVPERRHYITYQGSLNRPPCAESVDWIISNRPLRVDSAKFRSLFERLNTNQENIRPVKPLHRRLLRTTINNLQNHHQPLPSSNGPASRQFPEPMPLNSSAPTPSRPAENKISQDLRGQCQDRKQRASSSCSMKPRYVYQFAYQSAGSAI